MESILISVKKMLGIDKDYTQFDYNMPCALVIGNEGNGLTQQVIDACTLSLWC